MEKQDLSKVLIKDSEFYDSSAAYAAFLKRHNIITVEELLNGTFTRTTFNGFKMKGVTCSGLTTFIGLLKHKYFDTPLLADVYLDRSIDLERTVLESEHGRVIFTPVNGQPDETNIRFMCGVSGYFAFNRFIRKKNLQKFHREHNNLPIEDVSLIDFFKWIIEENRFNYLIPFAKAYIESYEKNIALVNEDAQTIGILKEQLTKLAEEKASIDAQIKDIQQKIDELSKKDSKGGMKI